MLVVLERAAVEHRAVRGLQHVLESLQAVIEGPSSEAWCTRSSDGEHVRARLRGQRQANLLPELSLRCFKCAVSGLDVAGR